LKSTGSALDWFDLTSKTLTWDFYNALGDLPSASANHGQIAHVHAEAAVYYAHNGSWVKLANDSRVDNSVSNIVLSGNDLSVTRQDGSAFLVTGVKPPQLSFAVQGGTVSNNGTTLQLSQTNGSPAAITGLTPSTIADGKTLTSGTYDLGAGSIAINQQDTTSITITGCPRPLSAYNAGAGSGNYYTPSFLNERIIPEVVSATNQYVLGNDGTNATWLSTLQVGTNTMNIGTSTIKKFSSWFSGTFLEYFMKATPSNGDTLGSVAFSDTSLNNYATFSGKVDDNSTRAGHFSFSTAFNNSIVEKLLVGKSDHSGSDAGQFKGVLKTDGIKFSGNTTQTKPVEDPATAGHVLTAGAGGTWSWAAPTGGGSGSVTTTPLPSYNFDENGPTNNSLDGIGYGQRINHMRVWQEGILSDINTQILVNGVRGDSGNTYMIAYIPIGGSLSFSWENGAAYPITKFTMNSHTSNATIVGATAKVRFVLGGSNDGVNFDWLGAFSTDNVSYTPPAPFASLTCYTTGGNYDGTTSTFYTPNTISSVAGGDNVQGASKTWRFTNTQGYRIYKWKLLDYPGSSSYSVIKYVRTLFIELSEVEFG
jgi:hypothetical protein